jgi:hypothetical protein
MEACLGPYTAASTLLASCFQSALPSAALITPRSQYRSLRGQGRAGRRGREAVREGGRPAAQGLAAAAGCGGDSGGGSGSSQAQAAAPGLRWLPPLGPLSHAARPRTGSVDVHQARGRA